MPRRFATEVHKTVSRLLNVGLLRQQPLWYTAVLENPPLPTPPRSATPRSLFDIKDPNSPSSKVQKKLAFKHGTTPRPKPTRVVYLEDKVRQQFYKDHPFEAFRPKTLVENQADIRPLHPIQGEEWTRLRQHGRNPTPEDAIEFAVSLHKHHDMPLSYAYQTAVVQYRSLRSEHFIANAVAVQEAESYGAQFGPTQLEKSLARETEQLETLTPQTRQAEKLSSKLPWTAVWEMPGAPQPPEEFTGGKAYLEAVRAGVRPTYKPLIESTFEELDEVEEQEVRGPTFQEVRAKHNSMRRAKDKAKADKLDFAEVLKASQ
ncbi:mitochondrial ribosomal small subunit component [Tulasnella sp. 419]|nr:mitochondrial ribosomal small subunit component [Tulasnella sp. 418]KAG8970674.1 mitochondrial ribosomal small subunit component [Tulasnella sp. 419]